MNWRKAGVNCLRAREYSRIVCLHTELDLTNARTRTATVRERFLERYPLEASVCKTAIDRLQRSAVSCESAPPTPLPLRLGAEHLFQTFCRDPVRPDGRFAARVQGRAVADRAYKVLYARIMQVGGHREMFLALRTAH